MLYLDTFKSKLADLASKRRSFITILIMPVVAGSKLINTGSVTPLLPDHVCILSSLKPFLSGYLAV